ncbi:MAG TPA: tetratricopeptide repeat protein [Lysobacter sp.]|nr:tetratricopeptide repeat protein [Lysobacter sp.]
MNQRKHPTKARHFLAPALLAMLLPVLAVSHEASARDKKQNTEQADNKYPGATREAPVQSVSAKLKPSVMKLYKAYEKKDVASVVQLADEIIANPEGNAYDHAFAARLAGVSLLNDDNEKAKAYLQKAIDFNGLSNNEHYESMRLIAQIELGDQDYAAGLASLDRYMQETKSQNGDDLAIKGNALYRLKRYPEAIASLKAAVDAGPEPKADWLKMLMAAYFDSNQPQEAARVAEGLIAKHPDDKSLQLNLAASYMQAGQDDKAVALLEKLRASGGLTTEADYRNLYAMYINNNKNKQGIAVIQEGLNKGVLHEDFQTMNALAEAYYFSGETQPAIDAYRKAAPLAPDGETYLNLARALLNEGRAAEAKQAAKQALDKGGINAADAKKIIGI